MQEFSDCAMLHTRARKLAKAAQTSAEVDEIEVAQAGPLVVEDTDYCQADLSHSSPSASPTSLRRHASRRSGGERNATTTVLKRQWAILTIQAR